MLRRARFTSDQVKRLIKEIERHTCLWNKEDEHHNDIFHVGTAWKAIAENMGLSENIVKQKWKNLRDTFHRVASKHGSAHYTGDWPFFEDMAFLQAPKRETEDQEYFLLSVSAEDDVLPHSDEYYDLLFLESLAPYFKRLEPVRRVAMRAKIQDMLMKDIVAQSDENLSQDED